MAGHTHIPSRSPRSAAFVVLGVALVLWLLLRFPLLIWIDAYKAVILALLTSQSLAPIPCAGSEAVDHRVII